MKTNYLLVEEKRIFYTSTEYRIIGLYETFDNVYNSFLKITSDKEWKIAHIDGDETVLDLTPIECRYNTSINSQCSSIYILKIPIL